MIRYKKKELNPFKWIFYSSRTNSPSFQTDGDYKLLFLGDPCKVSCPVQFHVCIIRTSENYQDWDWNKATWSSTIRLSPPSGIEESCGLTVSLSCPIVMTKKNIERGDLSTHAMFQASTAYILLRQLFIRMFHSLKILNKKQKPVVRIHGRTDSGLPALLPSSDALYRTEFTNRRPAACLHPNGATTTNKKGREAECPVGSLAQKAQLWADMLPGWGAGWKVSVLLTETLYRARCDWVINIICSSL